MPDSNDDLDLGERCVVCVCGGGQANTLPFYSTTTIGLPLSLRSKELLIDFSRPVGTVKLEYEVFNSFVLSCGL